MKTPQQKRWDKRIWTCCNADFHGSANYRLHRILIHNMKLYFCQVCSKAFPNKYCALRHAENDIERMERNRKKQNAKPNEA